MDIRVNTWIELQEARKFSVAKCIETYGEYVQSSSRVGRPWCFASEMSLVRDEAAGL